MNLTLVTGKKQIKLEAASEGESAEFSAQSDILKSEIKGKVSIKIGDARYQVTIVHHDGHEGHGHDDHKGHKH